MNMIIPGELRLPQDASGFVRRQCPKCRRCFKTLPSLADGRVLQAVLAKGLPHFNISELAPDVRSACFYCGTVAAATEWLTSEQRSFFTGFAHALAAQIRHRQLSDVTAAVRARAPLAAVPAPPAALRMAPDVNDMSLYSTVCCGDVKAQPGWTRSYFCPRCGTEHRPPTSDSVRGATSWFTAQAPVTS